MDRSIPVQGFILFLIFFFCAERTFPVIVPKSDKEEQERITIKKNSDPSRSVYSFKQTDILRQPFKDPVINRYILKGDSLFNIYKAEQALVWYKKAEYRFNALGNQDKVKLYIRLARAHHDIFNFETSLTYLVSALKYCEEGDMEEEYALVLLKTGATNRILNKFEQAIHYCFEALKYFEQKNQTENIAKVFFTLGETHSAAKNYSLALKYYKKAYGLAGDSLTTFYVNLVGNMILLLAENGNVKESEKYISRLISISDKCDDAELLRDIYVRLSMFYGSYVLEYKKAITFLYKGLAITDSCDQRYSYAVILLNLGGYYLDSDSLVKAERALSGSLKMMQEFGNKYSLASIYSKLGNLALKNEDTTRAIQYLIKCEENSIGTFMLPQILGLNLQLAEIYKGSGNYKAAATYLEKAIIIQDSLYVMRLSERITAMQMNHQMIEDQKEKDHLKQTNRLEAEKRKNLWYLLITVILAALITTSTLYILYRIKKKNNRILAEQGEKLRLLNATKDKFFSIIAHDLKNPFNTLMGLSEILSEDYRSLPPEDVKSYLKVINQASVQGNDLLENLLQWSRTQTGKIAFNPMPLDLNPLISETISLLQSNAFSKNITILFEPGETGVLEADREMVSTVIRNLVSNALKFTQRGGSIQVTTSAMNGEVLISVKDNGTGMSVEKIEKLFRIDTQISTRGTEKERGTGLGLILCHEFISAHKGRIEVVSEEGKGSEFRVFLTVKQ